MRLNIDPLAIEQLLRALAGEGLDLVHRVKPGVIRHRRTVRQVFNQPWPQLDLRPVNGRELLRHLSTDLQPVTPIDKNPGNRLRHRSEPGRAGKPGEPRQTLV